MRINDFLLQFMEQEGASSLLQFWLTADNFHHQLSSPGHVHDPSVDTADAISIYDRSILVIMHICMHACMHTHNGWFTSHSCMHGHYPCR